MKYDNNPVIGYSAFILFEECYEYNENACYIADTTESLKEFLIGATFHINDYRIDTIRLNDIIDDYGCSNGEFAMEPEALKRFEQAPGLKYTLEPFDDPFMDGEPDLFVINIEKKTDDNTDDFTIPGILESFSVYDGNYKREQIDAAINMKNEITPYLIEILKNAQTDYEKYISDEKLYDHIYALMLLGHLKEPKSHKVIIDLFSLPGDIPDKLFGDLTTSSLPVILLNTCYGSIELIKSLILNKEAYDYCRLSACQALSYAVIKGYVSRESVLELFGTLFTGEEAGETSDFWGLLADYVCDLYPEEIIDVIKQAYEDGLIIPGMTHYSDFEEALEIGKDKCLEKLKANLERNSFEDIHDTMSWWACFKEKPDTFSSSFGMENYLLPDYSVPSSKKPPKARKKVKKKKRKQAKASRKKNRR
ncbi:MAG: DUF1186 domain-containing protein [Desulfobacula sp.]|jgi:hypothetical protein|uniref:DUF1186 domain-containing protein n=1 Tax=Desulfobacula sp. TaxID=2593537 RepID=UPI001DF335EA|nr:DUF1186 domain-containing protein [Desulfobacula sp.]MBT4024494.1 DUF1186 domain-containing protein [Desulfobacula sp.]MBT4199814.1 DUF1186 domain-containing protein [Desulfobacula sp.]MBT4507810.1 DUF1186 domain-containing protein [Desulfobacula sp.]MBT5971289.1 DUF1186 domain-containing protein [Desulfobacula sp.]